MGEEMLREIIGYQEVLGKEHPDYLKSSGELADNLLLQGRLLEA
jgi:hypothetical protein